MQQRRGSHWSRWPGVVQAACSNICIGCCLLANLQIWKTVCYEGPEEGQLKSTILVYGQLSQAGQPRQTLHL